MNDHLSWDEQQPQYRTYAEACAALELNRRHLSRAPAWRGAQMGILRQGDGWDMHFLLNHAYKHDYARTADVGYIREYLVSNWVDLSPCVSPHWRPVRVAGCAQGAARELIDLTRRRMQIRVESPAQPEMRGSGWVR
jgi:hypothetical protein